MSVGNLTGENRDGIKYDMAVARHGFAGIQETHTEHSSELINTFLLIYNTSSS
jgi:hypothetical protein